MLLNVDDPSLNLILNGSLMGIAVIALLSVIPWGLIGRGANLARWLPLPALGLYLVYETAMPARMDIRLDLLLIVPMGMLIFGAWGIRMFFGETSARSRAKD